MMRCVGEKERAVAAAEHVVALSACPAKMLTVHQQHELYLISM